MKHGPQNRGIHALTKTKRRFSRGVVWTSATCKCRLRHKERNLFAEKNKLKLKFTL